MDPCPTLAYIIHITDTSYRGWPINLPADFRLLNFFVSRLEILRVQTERRASWGTRPP